MIFVPLFSCHQRKPLLAVWMTCCLGAFEVCWNGNGEVFEVCWNGNGEVFEVCWNGNGETFEVHWNGNGETFEVHWNGNGEMFEGARVHYLMDEEVIILETETGLAMIPRWLDSRLSFLLHQYQTHHC